MFDRGDIDERSVFPFLTVLKRIVDDVEKHNKECPNDEWLPPEHLWVRPLLLQQI